MGMIKYIFKKEGQVNPKEFSKLKSLLVPLFSFSHHFSQSYKKHGTLYFSSRPRYRLFVYNDDELIGSLSIVDRKINKPFLLRIAGLGNLAIKKSHQGRGLAGKTLKETHKFLKEKNMDISLLFCVEKLKYVYIKAGYQQLDKPVTYLDEENSISEESLSLLYPILASEDKVRKIMSEGIFIGKGSW